MNQLLEKLPEALTASEETTLVNALIRRFQIEFTKNDKSGIYGHTQYAMAYNSNKIEGSQLTEQQTVSLFDTGTISADGTFFKAKDIEETTGHFMMFNEMLKNHEMPLSEEIIKKYHFRLKSGVFEDFANGYLAGEYKNRENRIANIVTAKVSEVPDKMNALLTELGCKQNIQVSDLARVHIQFETIHPFQDGNGRTGRMILFHECLRNGILPFIIQDKNKLQYYEALNAAQTKNDYEKMEAFFRKEQTDYYGLMKHYLRVSPDSI
ncbi:hypothetical protein FACS1894111_04180 [Clostridia bacterium]|nr:hypothetical protein FACS1894111_04180 [Clostridia bacterium]